MEIVRLGPGDEARLVAASDLFDEPVTAEVAARFLTSPGHHVLLAVLDGTDAGFITGVETTHPDKGTEMFLYELGVDEGFRRRGAARALVDALGEVARANGCVGMWVATEADNEAALATYRSAGASLPAPGVTLEWRFDPPEG